jgi:hypothetical protein
MNISRNQLLSPIDVIVAVVSQAMLLAFQMFVLPAE